MNAKAGRFDREFDAGEDTSPYLDISKARRSGQQQNLQPPSDELYARFPHLETERLVLRQLRPADAPDLFRLFADDQVTRYYDLDTFTRISQARALIDRFAQRYQNRIGIRWAIALRACPDGLLGTCGYNMWLQTSRRAILGYDLASAHWRQGIMSEALRAVIRFGFERMELNRIEALVFQANAASRGLLEKLAFQPEGVLREYEYLKGRFTDMAMYSLLRRDYSTGDRPCST